MSKKVSNECPYNSREEDAKHRPKPPKESKIENKNLDNPESCDLCYKSDHFGIPGGKCMKHRVSDNLKKREFEYSMSHEKQLIDRLDTVIDRLDSIEGFIRWFRDNKE